MYQIINVRYGAGLDFKGQLPRDFQPFYYKDGGKINHEEADFTSVESYL